MTPFRSEKNTNWKAVFMEQRATGTLQVWLEPFVPPRIPKLFNVRTDPYERADVRANTIDQAVAKLEAALASGQ